MRETPVISTVTQHSLISLDYSTNAPWFTFQHSLIGSIKILTVKITEIIIIMMISSTFI